MAETEVLLSVPAASRGECEQKANTGEWNWSLDPGSLWEGCSFVTAVSLTRPKGYFLLDFVSSYSSYL